MYCNGQESSKNGIMRHKLLANLSIVVFEIIVWNFYDFCYSQNIRVAPKLFLNSTTKYNDSSIVKK